MTPRGEALSLARTAALFARLKLRILRNAFRGGGGSRSGAVVGWIMSGLAGVGGFAASLALRTAGSSDALLAATIVGGALGAVALLVPVLVLGIDEAISPERLVLFPLGRTRRVVGLGISAVLSPVGIALALALVGMVVGLTRSALGAVFATAVAAELLVTSIVTSRVLPTALSRVMSSRRGRDAALALASLVGFSGLIVQFVARSVHVGRNRLEQMARIVRWTPPGALGRALADAGAGRLVPATTALLYGMAGLLAVAALWGWTLDRAERHPPGPAATRRGRAAGAVPLFDGPRRWLPPTTVGSVAARELLYMTRDPRRRVAAISALVMGVVLPLVNNANRGSGASALFAASAAWFAVLNAMNQFGLDGRALWFDLLSGATPKQLLRGKNIAYAIAVVPVVTLASIVLAAVTHGWAYVPAAILTGAGTMVAGLGPANVASVFVPYPVPEGSNPFAMRSSGQGCLTGLIMLLAALAMSVLLAPVLVGLILARRSPLLCFVVGAGSVPYGLALRAAGAAIAAARLQGREPEMVLAVDPHR